MTDLIARLREAVGASHVLTDGADLVSYSSDWRGAYRNAGAV